MTMPVEVVTIGHILNETIVFADGTRKGPVLGSPAAYSSVVTARLGVTTGIVTMAGSDAPAALLQPLMDAGVNLKGVCSGGGVTTTNELVYARDGSKELRYVKQAPPIALADIPDSYLKAKVFYVCPLDYEVPVETVAGLSRPGGILATDLGGYGGAHVNRKTYAEKKFSAPGLKKLIGMFKIVKASDEDCKMLFPGEELSEEQCARRFVEWGAGVGIVTMGERGSRVATSEERYHVPAISGKVTDVTGGGDSYMGGFLAEFMRTGNVRQSAVFASAVALCVIEGTGGVRASRMPAYDDARKRIPQRSENEKI